MKAAAVPLLCAALSALAGCASTPAPEAESASPSAPAVALAELEDIFWHCDYVATTRGMDATPVRECAAATRELRRLKFDGSFYRLRVVAREQVGGARQAPRGAQRVEALKPPAQRGTKPRPV